MRSSKWLAIGLLSTVAVAAQAAHVDFKDPKRALGRDDNVRIDAELTDDIVSSSSPIAITYQIQNLSSATVAIADKVSDSDYDADSQTITLSIGAEIPKENVPHLVTIKPGEKRTLTTGAYARVATPSIRTPWTSVPRYVEIKVTLLRNVAPFLPFIEQQAKSQAPQPFPNELFDRWVEGSSSVYLNAIPIEWKQGNRIGGDASRAGVGGEF